jgi:hypothetical protein
LVANDVHLEIVIVDFSISNCPVGLDCVVARIMDINRVICGIVDFAELARRDDDHGAAVDAGDYIRLIDAVELGIRC